MESKQIDRIYDTLAMILTLKTGIKFVHRVVELDAVATETRCKGENRESEENEAV